MSEYDGWVISFALTELLEKIRTQRKLKHSLLLQKQFQKGHCEVPVLSLKTFITALLSLYVLICSGGKVSEAKLFHKFTYTIIILA